MLSPEDILLHRIEIVVPDYTGVPVVGCDPSSRTRDHDIVHNGHIHGIVGEYLLVVHIGSVPVGGVVDDVHMAGPEGMDARTSVVRADIVGDKGTVLPHRSLILPYGSGLIGDNGIRIRIGQILSVLVGHIQQDSVAIAQLPYLLP